jgi:translation initiation factor 2B subunit (eIF-2B alpha/beta/delta family)
MLFQVISASSEDELAGFIKDLAERNELLAKALQQAAPQVAAVGVSNDEVAARTDRFIKALAHGAEIAREGGHIKAAALSWTDGKAAVAETLAALGEYVDLVKKVMADSAAQAAHDANEADLILTATMIASLLIAIGAASWVSIAIARALGHKLIKGIPFAGEL